MDMFPRLKELDAVTRLSLEQKLQPYEHMARTGGVEAFIPYQEPTFFRIYFTKVKDTWINHKIHMDNFLRCISGSRESLPPNRPTWKKILSKLVKTPERDTLKNSEQRLGFRIDNLFIVKQKFTFGQQHVDRGTKHVYQTADAPVYMWVLPAKYNNSRAHPSTTRRSMDHLDEWMYDTKVMEPHSCYFLTQGTKYVIATYQKTMFTVDVVGEHVPLPDHAQDYRRARNEYTPETYTLPPPTPAHVPFAEPHRPEPPPKRARISRVSQRPESSRVPQILPQILFPELVEPVQEPQPEVFQQPEVAPQVDPQPEVVQPEVVQQEVVQPEVVYPVVFYEVPQTEEEQPPPNFSFDDLMQDDGTLDFSCLLDNKELEDAVVNLAVEMEMLPEEPVLTEESVEDQPLDLRTFNKFPKTLKYGIQFKRPLDLSRV